MLVFNYKIFLAILELSNYQLKIIICYIDIYNILKFFV